MKYLNQVAEVYRIDTEEEVQAFIEDMKAKAIDEGYVLKSCAYTLKEKKSKGEVIDSAYQVKVVKDFAEFWEY